MKARFKRFARAPWAYGILIITTVGNAGLNTDLAAPPRFDGAGYAVLGEALATGRGYREINEPGAPRHDHFPPGYPAALAFLWSLTGRSVVAAHVFSIVCTTAAVLLAWQWYKTLYSPALALALALALSLNWTWGRIGGSIQSEPFYLVCEMVAILAATRAGRRDRLTDAVVLGVALATCTLVRHVGLFLVAAVMIELGIRRRWKTLVVSGTTAALCILPWCFWLASVQHHSQVGLLTAENLPARLREQILFYVQRLPDQLTGPFVEVATVLHRFSAFIIVANTWAIVISGVILWGWMRTLATPRRRIAGLVGFTNLALLLFWPFTEAGRFLIPLVPFLLDGLLEGIASILALLPRSRPRIWSIGMILALSVPYSAYSIMGRRADAQRRLYSAFDAACSWIATSGTRPGAVLTRHPGEVFWQVGRTTIAPGATDPAAIDALIGRAGVAYLLIDEERYVNMTTSPLRHYVERYPDRVRLCWEDRQGSASVRVFEIVPAK